MEETSSWTCASLRNLVFHSSLYRLFLMTFNILFAYLKNLVLQKFAKSHSLLFFTLYLEKIHTTACKMKLLITVGFHLSTFNWFPLPSSHFAISNCSQSPQKLISSITDFRVMVISNLTTKPYNLFYFLCWKYKYKSKSNMN